MKNLVFSFCLAIVLLSGHSYATETKSSEPFENEDEKFELVVYLNNDEFSPDRINRELELGSTDVKEHFGEVLSARYLIQDRRDIGIYTPFEGRSVEEALQKPDIQPDLSLLHPNSVEAILQRYIVLTYPNEEFKLNAKAALERSSLAKSVVSVEKGEFLSTIPNDPFFVDLDKRQWGMYELNLPNAWDLSTGYAYIGVPDSGLAITHPDLTNYRPHFSKNFTAVNGTLISDFNGHGTHVTGIIAATTNNGDGVAGVCHRCSIAFARIDTYATTLAEAYTYLINGGVQVLNSSFAITGSSDWGGEICAGPDPDPDPDPRFNPDAFCIALDLVSERDVIVSAAAGNGLGGDKIAHPTLGGPTYREGRSNFIQFPASHPEVIAVGAINYSGNRAPFSDYGSELDLVAPGGSIQSTIYDWYPDGLCSDSVGPSSETDGYGNCTGTSMAAPHISSLLGIMRSVDPLLRVAKVKEALYSSGSFPISKDQELGHGVPDAKFAVESILGEVDGSFIENRLTPLFSLYSSVGTDSFYTTVPQMAYAAIKGTMR